MIGEKKIVVTMSERTGLNIESIHPDMDLDETIRRALSLYDYMIQVERDGGRVFVKEAGGVTRIVPVDY